jgi:DNA-binding HxlR family transcriptional regulator
MARKNIEMNRKIEFLKKYILRQNTIRLLNVLYKRDMTCSELRANGVKRTDRITDMLSITKKYTDENNIVMYGLTENGKKLNESIQSLLSTTENFLPEGD